MRPQPERFLQELRQLVPTAIQKDLEDRLPLMDAYTAATVAPPGWLIQGLLPRAAVAVLYGREGVGKSFLALDLALSVSRNEPWLQQFPIHNPTRRPVLYVAAEGAYNLGRRVRAYLLYKTPQEGGLFHGLSIPFYILAEAVRFDVPESLHRLYATILSISMDAPPILIVFDTLHACLPRADENDASTFGLVMTVANFLRHGAGTTVLFLHHARKTGDVYRGSSSLAGDSDTILHLLPVAGRPPDPPTDLLASGPARRLELLTEKQKDGPASDPLPLSLVPVFLPHQEREPDPGDLPNTACILIGADELQEQVYKDRVNLIRGVLRRYRTPPLAADLARATGLSRRTLSRVLEQARDRGDLKDLQNLLPPATPQSP